MRELMYTKGIPNIIFLLMRWDLGKSGVGR